MLAQHQALSRVFVPPCTGGMFAPPAAALGPDTSRRLAGTLAACCVLQVMQNGCQAMARGEGWFFRHPAVGDAWIAQITANSRTIRLIFGHNRNFGKVAEALSQIRRPNQTEGLRRAV